MSRLIKEERNMYIVSMINYSSSGQRTIFFLKPDFLEGKEMGIWRLDILGAEMFKDRNSAETAMKAAIKFTQRFNDSISVDAFNVYPVKVDYAYGG